MSTNSALSAPYAMYPVFSTWHVCPTVTFAYLTIKYCLVSVQPLRIDNLYARADEVEADGAVDIETA